MTNPFKLVTEDAPVLTENTPVVTEAPQAESNIDFPLFDKRVIYDANGQVISGFAAITNTKDQNVNAVMSDRYTIFNHNEAHEIIESAAKNLCPEVRGDVQFHKNDGFMKVIYDLPESYNIQVGEGDSLRTRLVGMNSVGGSKCLSFHVDFERLVCTNGMVGFSREFSFTRRHSKFIHSDVQDFNIAAQLETAWKTVVANAETLKNNAVDFNKGMAAIKEMVDRKLFPKKLELWISEEWRRASVGANNEQAENGSNLWTLYNSFTSAISHHTDNKGQGLSEQSKELYGNRINGLILKLAA